MYCKRDILVFLATNHFDQVSIEELKLTIKSKDERKNEELPKIKNLMKIPGAVFNYSYENNSCVDYKLENKGAKWRIKLAEMIQFGYILLDMKVNSSTSSIQDNIELLIKRYQHADYEKCNYKESPIRLHPDDHLYRFEFLCEFQQQKEIRKIEIHFNNIFSFSLCALKLFRFSTECGVPQVRLGVQYDYNQQNNEWNFNCVDPQDSLIGSQQISVCVNGLWNEESPVCTKPITTCGDIHSNKMIITTNTNEKIEVDANKTWLNPSWEQFIREARENQYKENASQLICFSGSWNDFDLKFKNNDRGDKIESIYKITTIILFVGIFILILTVIPIIIRASRNRKEHLAIIKETSIKSQSNKYCDYEDSYDDIVDNKEDYYSLRLSVCEDVAYETLPDI